MPDKKEVEIIGGSSMNQRGETKIIDSRTKRIDIEAINRGGQIVRVRENEVAVKEHTRTSHNPSSPQVEVKSHVRSKPKQAKPKGKK